MVKNKKRAGNDNHKRAKRNITKPKALQFIVNIVKSYTSISDVDFGEPSLDDELYSYELKIIKGMPINALAIHNNSRTVPVVPLKSGVLLYISISYKSPAYGTFEFSNITMQFFDSNKKLIFRAELGDDIEDSNEEDKIHHPQPHWHLDTTGLLNKSNPSYNFTDKIIKDNTFVSTYENKTSEKIIDFSRLHLFMDYNNPIINRRWQENEVIDWVKKTLGSICKELDFISK